MRRALAERETKETIKLIAISLLVMIIYLCFSFSSAYGYSVSSLDRIRFNDTDTINWNSQTWMNYNKLSSSTYGNTMTWTNYDRPITNMDDSNTGDDRVVPSIPEPSVIMLLGIGLAGFALYRKFRY